MLAIQPGIVATSCVRWPRGKDFGWGFQAPLSVGTRSIALRVLAISWSNSGSRDSAKPMVIS